MDLPKSRKCCKGRDEMIRDLQAELYRHKKALRAKEEEVATLRDRIGDLREENPDV